MSPTVHRERQRRPKTSQEERICSICSQSFKKAEHLARHIRSHTKERPFTCDVCGKFYARQDTLLRHARSHRGNAQPNRHPSEDHGSAAGRSPVNPQNEQQDSSIAPSDAAGQATSDPENEQMVLDLPLPPNQILQPELTGSILDTSTGNLPVQENNQPINDHVGMMPQWPSTDMNDIMPTETSPWSIMPDERRDLDWMSWLTGPDFDLDALNQSLLDTTEIQIRDPIPNSDEARGQIQRRWHTFSESVVSSGQTTPDLRRPGSSDRCQIHMIADESYRKKLAESLQQRVQPGILPSTGFLDFCLQAYFKHFQAIFPLIHVPTFCPSKKNALLLLSICSIGSLFLGSSRAMAHGISMFERLQKSILASWDTHISGVGDSSIIPLQASVIGQTFGLLVGRPKDLTGIEVFHGSIVAWARSAKLFKVVDEPISPINIEGNSEELEGAWKAWARIEEKKRIILGIYIHDVELAKLHHHEPVLRHAIEKIPKLSPPSVFTAPNAAAWKKQLLITQTPVPIPPSPPHTDPMSLLTETRPGNDLESYAILESIGSLVLEDRGCTGAYPATVEKCQRLLIQWHLQRHNHSPENDIQSITQVDPFCLRILWHSTFMHLYTRFDDLECACGREGETQSQQKCAYAASWAKSMDAKRTLLHATLIQKQLQSLALGAEPAVHVPMALYYVGIAWASFTQFGGASDARIKHGTDDLDFPELRLLGVNQTQLFGEMTSGIQMGRPESGPLFRAIDLLGKINHWKVSQNLSSTLLAFVENMPDLF